MNKLNHFCSDSTNYLRPTTSSTQESLSEDSTSARLSICSAITLSPAISTAPQHSPTISTPNEEAMDVANHNERGRVSNALLPVIDGNSSINRRRRTELLLDQPSKITGNR